MSPEKHWLDRLADSCDKGADVLETAQVSRREVGKLGAETMAKVTATSILIPVVLAACEEDEVPPEVRDALLGAVQVTQSEYSPRNGNLRVTLSLPAGFNRLGQDVRAHMIAQLKINPDGLPAHSLLRNEGGFVRQKIGDEGLYLSGQPTVEDVAGHFDPQLFQGVERVYILFTQDLDFGQEAQLENLLRNEPSGHDDIIQQWAREEDTPDVIGPSPELIPFISQ